MNTTAPTYHVLNCMHVLKHVYWVHTASERGTEVEPITPPPRGENKASARIIWPIGVKTGGVTLVSIDSRAANETSFPATHA